MAGDEPVCVNQFNFRLVDCSSAILVARRALLMTSRARFEMKLGSLLLLVVLAAIVAFAALNWGELSASRELSLGVAEVRLPLGLLLFSLLVVLTVLYLGFIVYLQAVAHLQSRRHARELQTSRKLAEEVESSRLADLKSTVLARIDRQESELS